MAMTWFNQATHRLNKARAATPTSQHGDAATGDDFLLSLVEMVAAQEDVLMRMIAEMDRLRWRVVALERRFR